MKSNAKTIILLAAGICMLAGAHVWLSASPVHTAVAGRRQTLAPFQPSRICAFSIQRRGEPEFRVAQIEGEWRIVAPFVADADEQTAMRLADAISIAAPDAEYSDAELARFGRTRTDYGLDRPFVEIVAETDSGDICDIMFGENAPGGGVFAAVAGEKAVFAMPQSVLEAARSAASAFRRRDVVAVRPEDAAAIDLKRGGAFTSLIKDGGIWKRKATAEGNVDTIVPADAVEKLLAAVCCIKAEGFAWPTGAKDEPQTVTPALLAGYGIDEDSAPSITIKSPDGDVARIAFGREASEESAYALVQNSTAIAIVPAIARKAAVAVDFSDNRLFPADASAIKNITIIDGSVQWSLARRDNGSWDIESPVRAKADTDAVSALAKSISTLVAADAEENGETKVAIAAGDEPVSVRRDALLGDTDLINLRSKRMLDVEPRDIRRITISSGREGQDTTVKESSAIAAMLAGLDNLVAERVVALQASPQDMKRYGLDDPQAVLAIDLNGDGAIRRNILFGYKEDGGGIYATAGASDTVFSISPRAAQRLEIEKERWKKKQ